MDWCVLRSFNSGESSSRCEEITHTRVLWGSGRRGREERVKAGVEAEVEERERVRESRAGKRAQQSFDTHYHHYDTTHHTPHCRSHHQCHHHHHHQTTPNTLSHSNPTSRRTVSPPRLTSGITRGHWSHHSRGQPLTEPLTGPLCRCFGVSLRCRASWAWAIPARLNHGNLLASPPA